MGSEIAALLGAQTWRAFDVDDSGRVLAGSDESGSTQLVELGADGARTLTALPGACTGRYLPGERAVVVTTDAGGNERGQLSLLLLDPPPAEPATMDGLRPLVVDPEHRATLAGVLPGRIVYRTNRRNGVDSDVVIRNVRTGEEEVVYDGGGQVDTAAAGPGARYLAVTRAAQPALSDQVLLVDTMPETDDEHVVALTDATEHARNLEPAWLDEHTLLVSTDRNAEFTGLARVDIRTGEWTNLLAAAGHDLIGWPSPDGSLILVHTNDNGVTRLAVHDAHTGQVRNDIALPTDGWVSSEPWLSGGTIEPHWSPNGRFVTLTFSAPGVPGDVLLIDIAAGELHRLTDSGAAMAGLAVTPERVAVPSGAGDIHCRLYVPPSHVDRGAVVLVLHGGPEAQAVHRFSARLQALVRAGYTVLEPNVRGSTGYGKTFYSADDGRARLGVLDDLAALHGWAVANGFAADRVALYGGSYGGYLVLAGLAFQPELWAAGVAIVGISSLETFLRNTAGYRRAAREREYGSLEHDLDFLRAASPLSAVDDIRAPLFLLHGANDPRVPLGEAEQIAAALTARGAEATLLSYPDEGHGLAKLANRLDGYPKTIDFLDRHLPRA